MTLTMFAPAMVDISHTMNTSLQLVSLYTTFFSIGYIMGTLVGLLYKYLNRQLTTSLLLVLTSVSLAGLPHSPNIWFIYVSAWLIGVGAGSWNSIINVWLIEIWQHRSAPVLQFVQFMFGMGTIFSPLLLKTYLSGDRYDVITARYQLNARAINLLANYTVIDNDQVSDNKNNYAHQLWIPFLISGICQSTFPVILIMLFAVKRYELPTVPDATCPNIPAQSDQLKLFDIPGSPRRLCIALFACWLSTYCVTESTIMNFGATYLQYCPLKLSAQSAAEIVSLIALFFTIGRGVSIFVAMKLKPQTMISYHIVLLYISVCLLLFLGQYNRTVLWITVVCLGMALSALFPAMFAYLSEQEHFC
ncbi:major facilitator superfamily domain-containing protein 4A-like [Oppia nitens]|uniref:major facilitator superfamily domain-containing protein 4A-like n=1 Tax=Oppia nitens TaxID=1686743 RepID=UPI0023DCA8DD|nr:major facilitator superfamily domain-containing protein 4A-like [Oppia nitens]